MRQLRMPASVPERRLGPDELLARMRRDEARAQRRKIEADPVRSRYLLTEIGVGYRFADA